MTLLTFGSLTVSLALAAALTAAPLLAADQENAATAAAGEKKTEEPITARSGARLSPTLKVGGTARQTSTAKAQDQECKEVCSLANRHDHRDVFKLEPKK